MSQPPVTISLPGLILRSQAPESFTVAPFIPRASIVIAVGDSGLGKTPWAYQLALAVATGTPFLGFPTVAGPVLYADFENDQPLIGRMCAAMSVALGLPEPPATLHHLTDQDAALIEKGVREILLNGKRIAGNVIPVKMMRDENEVRVVMGN